MSKFQLKWGMLATGGIAETFARDLWLSPEIRDVHDIEHVVVAAASSSSAERAKSFLKEVRAPESAQAYGSYKELVADPNVDIIYVATPHSHHYQNAMLALEAGKNVLCEKPLTTNAAQTEKLIQKAREKGLFLMEAVWTRYFPLSVYVRDIITSGKIGTVHRCIADYSQPTDPETSFPDHKHRMVSLDLAGGALLDLGIYALNWVFQTLYFTQKNPQPPQVLSYSKKYAPTGADETTSVLLNFPRDQQDGGDLHGIATTSLRLTSDPSQNNSAGPSIRVQGSAGEIQVFPPANRPTKTRLILSDATVDERDWPQPASTNPTWKNGFGNVWNEHGQGHGMFWEADECARAIRDGRKEGQFEGLDESLVIMKVMDEVRKQNGLVYPSKIESTAYPIEL